MLSAILLLLDSSKFIWIDFHEMKTTIIIMTWRKMLVEEIASNQKQKQFRSVVNDDYLCHPANYTIYVLLFSKYIIFFSSQKCIILFYAPGYIFLIHWVGWFIRKYTIHCIKLHIYYYVYIQVCYYFVVLMYNFLLLHVVFSSGS